LIDDDERLHVMRCEIENGGDPNDHRQPNLHRRTP
jgi:hypothetical protein